MANIFKKLVGVSSKEKEKREENIIAQNLELEENVIENSENNNDEEWLEDNYEEGQLSIDVYQTPDKLVVKSTIAGVKPNDIDISMNNDMLTIRGKRELQDKVKDSDYLFRECYWGPFSRSIILPVEIDTEKIEASLENGVLTIILPKAKATKQISIKVKEK